MTHYDTLLVHGLVVTMDPAYAVIPDGAVAIQGNQIAAVGPVADLLAGAEVQEIVDCRDTVIIPGLINAHTHAPMTLLRGLADDLRLDVWLHGYMMPVEREFVDPDFCRLGTRLACAEMLRSGVTCFADMYYFEEEVATAAAQVGVRAVCAETILKFPAPGAPTYEDSLAYSRDFIARWRDHPLIRPAVGLHAPYTATPEMLDAAVRLAQEFDVPLLTHISETAYEVEEAERVWELSPVRWAREQGLFETHVVAAHCVHVDEAELRILARAGVGVIHNPSSNLKLASGVAPVPRMLALELPVGIGTDGAASNNDLDMFEELRLAALVAKGVSGDPLVLPAKATLSLATIGGARALGIDALVGSLEVGKRADIAVVGLDKLHLTPKFGRSPDAVYSQLIYAAKSTDVRDVWVDGRPLMRERRLLTLDEERLREDAQSLAQHIDTFLIAREGNVLDKLVAIGGVEITETFEIQVKVRVSDPERIVAILESHPQIAVVKPTIRRQYDTYFHFADPEQGRLRYREDEVLDQDGQADQVEDVFYMLTLTGPVKEREYENSVLLSRSRFTAHADRSLRFYREYFQPVKEIQVEKARKRYRIIYEDTAFAVNLDRLAGRPTGDTFLEIKSRTWSRGDAERKAQLIGELLALFGVQDQGLVKDQYFELVD